MFQYKVRKHYRCSICKQTKIFFRLDLKIRHHNGKIIYNVKTLVWDFATENCMNNIT